MINSGEQSGEITYACYSPCPAGKGPFTSCKHLPSCFVLCPWRVCTIEAEQAYQPWKRIGLIVNQNHAYYYQVQQQLFCSGYKYEDLVLSDLKEVIILNIKQSSSFSKKYVPKLKNFYYQYLAPELAYPRVTLGIPQLGKVIENVWTCISFCLETTSYR